MTIIAYRDGVMASDSQVSNDGLITGSFRKIIRCDDGSLAGGGGFTEDVEVFLQWIKVGGPKDTIPKSDVSFNGLLVRDDGTVFCLDNGLIPYEVAAPFFAIGSGNAVAIGAMEMGASAIQAVEVCIRRLTCCGGAIQSLVLGSS